MPQQSYTHAVSRHAASKHSKQPVSLTHANYTSSRYNCHPTHPYRAHTPPCLRAPTLPTQHATRPFPTKHATITFTLVTSTSSTSQPQTNNCTSTTHTTHQSQHTCSGFERRSRRTTASPQPSFRACNDASGGGQERVCARACTML